MPRHAAVFVNIQGSWRVVVPRMKTLVDLKPIMIEGETR
jgi:hypothetical protein